jgi:hypothetical protein
MGQELIEVFMEEWKDVADALGYSGESNREWLFSNVTEEWASWRLKFYF